MTLDALIENAQSIAVAAHIRPDGDCLGAALAVKEILSGRGKPCDFLCDAEVPWQYSFMPKVSSMNEKREKSYDLFISVDCADEARLGNIAEVMKKSKNTVNIDHHISNTHFAALNIVSPDASSTCEMIFDLFDSEIQGDAAIDIYVGLSTDTGHFMHSNTTSRVLEIAAQLTRRGVNPSDTARALYKNNKLPKTKLIARAIQSMRFFDDGKICIMSVLTSDFEQLSLKLTDTEGLIDHAVAISGVDVAVCLSQQGANHYKVSLRSKIADVSKIAAVFGGGGHVHAAGCILNGHYETVIEKLLKAIRDYSE